MADRIESDAEIVLGRLDRFETVHVALPERQQAVARLAQRGLVRFRWGEGCDAGLMLVRKAPPGARRPWPFGGLSA